MVARSLTWFAMHDEEDPTDVGELAIVAAARSDPAAFAPLYRRYAPLILRYCQRQLGDPELANDATSQTFVKAIAALPRFDLPEHRSGATIRSWLFTIAHNVIVDQHRRKRGDLSLDNATWLHTSDRLAANDATPAEIAIANESAGTLRTALQQLPQRQRQIVELRLVGLTGTEIAVVIGTTHGAIKAAQARAYATLRELLRNTPEFTDVSS